MEDKENKPKVLSCMVRGPGPVYKLPTLVGYQEHDPSKRRSPAYSIRTRTGIQFTSIGPGPKYSVTKLTRHGPDTMPAYTIAHRREISVKDVGPGPGAHYPELCPPMNHNIRPPAYSIKSKDESKFGDDAPGPNAYVLPSCIGPKIPDKPAQGAFSIAGYHELRQIDVGPGPAAYLNLNQDLIKRRSPAYTLKWRRDIGGEYVGPGPQYNPSYVTGKRSPKFSFGVKHSECAGTPITDLDED